MTTRTTETSPQVYARIGGVLYLITIVLGAAGELFVRGSIVVPGDATATAANLRSMESLWRFGIASELFLGICTIVLTLILYVLLRPVRNDGIRRLRRLHRLGIEADKLNSSENGSWMLLFTWRESSQPVLS